MEKLITYNSNALRFLMSEDIYLVNEKILSNSILLSEKIHEPIPEISTEENQNTSFNYAGENNKYFLIIFEDEANSELNSAHKEMLMKIMSAKGLEMRDLAILNLSKYPEANFSQLKSFFSCNRIALFGIDPQRITLPAIAANDSVKHQDVKVLASFSLEEMSNNNDKKREFWAVMKNF
jgi:hypothetical protein